MTTQQQAPPKPLPVPNELTRPYWEAAKQGKLLAQRCKTCDELFFYPREFCPRCLSRDLTWEQLSGKGRVYTYTVIRQAAHPAFNADLPYIYAVVQMIEGPRMYTNVVCPIEDVYVDMPVEVFFDRASDEISLVKWKPAANWKEARAEASPMASVVPKSS